MKPQRPARLCCVVTSQTEGTGVTVRGKGIDWVAGHHRLAGGVTPADPASWARQPPQESVGVAPAGSLMSEEAVIDPQRSQEHVGVGRLRNRNLGTCPARGSQAVALEHGAGWTAQGRSLYFESAPGPRGPPAGALESAYTGDTVSLDHVAGRGLRKPLVRRPCRGGAGGQRESSLPLPWGQRLQKTMEAAPWEKNQARISGHPSWDSKDAFSERFPGGVQKGGGPLCPAGPHSF